MQDSIMHYIRNAFAYMDRSDGKPAPRGGSKTRGRRPSADRHLPLQGRRPERLRLHLRGAANPEHWTRLLKVMGREDLAGDERYSTAAARLERWAEVDEMVSSWTRQLDKHTVMRLVGADCPGWSGARYARAR